MLLSFCGGSVTVELSIPSVISLEWVEANINLLNALSVKSAEYKALKVAMADGLKVIQSKADDNGNGRLWLKAEALLDEVYYYDNLESERELHEYAKHMNEPDFDWDYYSDWHKDVYGFRPR